MDGLNILELLQYNYTMHRLENKYVLKLFYPFFSFLELPILSEQTTEAMHRLFLLVHVRMALNTIQKNMLVSSIQRISCLLTIL